MKLNEISLNYPVILFLLSFFYCIGSISCKEKKSIPAHHYLFADTVSVEIESDTLNQESQFSIEFNIDRDPNRGTWQNPDLVIRNLGNVSDKIVADIGSGTGYFTIPISRIANKVIAIDIEQRYLDYIEDLKLELPIELAERIETRLTVEDEPNLHTDEVDAVLMVNVFYYLGNKTEYMRIVRDALRKKGVLVLVDFKPGDLPVGPADIKFSAQEVVVVLRNAGFDQINVDEGSLQYQFIITAN